MGATFTHIQTSSPPTLIYEPSSILEALNLSRLFPKRQPLELELGSGDGSFLVELAQTFPDRNFIGVERLLGRIRKLDKKARRAGVSNLRALRIESAYFLQYLLPAHSASALHIYFPDPWPKRKHRKHRLVNLDFPDLAQRALAPMGTIYLRTDDPDYFAQMREVFHASPWFRAVATPSKLAELVTDFERDFTARNIKTLHAAYQLQS